MITVILLAAGKGSRTTFSDNKIKYNLKGLPVFMHSYKLFNKLGYNIITVIRKEDEEFILNYIDTPITYGGETRLESVENGLKLVNSKYVLIHDGARPFISEEVVLELVESLKRFDASMVCKKATSTFYDTNLEIIDRNNLIEAETPQAFLTSKIKEAFSNRLNDSYTDDISLYKSYYKDEKIGLVYHTTNNEKLTTKEQMESHMEQGYKIGHAYDIHKLVKDRKLILAGVHIDHLYGLLGHSDADVVYHAVAESILGALGLGDLGTHFPDTDLKYKDLNSKEIMLYVKDKCEKLDYEIVNLDVSIYAEEPKLAPYIKQMKKNIAEALNINVNQVNVKAGTNETLDAVGKKEAIASESVCLLKVYIK